MLRMPVSMKHEKNANWKLRFASILIAALLAAPGPSCFSKPIKDLQANRVTTQDEFAWALGCDKFGIYLKGRRTGYGSAKLARDRKDDSFVDSTNFRLATGPGEMDEHQEEQRFESRSPYRLKLAKQTVVQGGSREVRRCRPEKNGLVFTSEIDGKTTTKLVKGLTFCISDALAVRRWVRQNPKIGSTLDCKSLDISTNSIDVDHNTVVSKNSTSTKGTTSAIFHIAVSSKEGKTFEDYDAEGKLMSADYMAFKLKRENEIGSRRLSPVNFDELMKITIDKPLGNPAEVDELTIEIPRDYGDVFKAGLMQTVSRTSSGNWLCKIKRGSEKIASKDDIEASLQSTSMYPTENPDIVFIAKKISTVTKGKTQNEKISFLTGFVGAFVSNDLTARTTSISTILRTRKGACTEHAQLFTTLARALKIPARDVSGICYADKTERKFFGHTWNEVVVDGKWVAVDPTLAEQRADATHITITDDDFVRAAMTPMKLRLIQVRSAGKRFPSHDL